MNLSVGIVGLPNAGKSTLFNALIKRQQAETAKHPFTTINPNKGIINVPDSRLKDIAKITGIGKQTPATIEFVDIAGLVKGAYKGEGLGNQFLGHIREVSVILHIIRGFTDTSITHMYQTIDPQRDLEIVNTELMLADLAMLDKIIGQNTKDQVLNNFLLKLKTCLNQGKLIDKDKLSEEEKVFYQQYPLLSSKPQIIVINIDEKDISIINKDTISICAKLEEELIALNPSEQQEFYQSYNLKESGIDKVIKRCYQKLNLITFYTIVKGNEARAWPIVKGTNAIIAAGEVHTDFAKKFIKAEVVSYNDFVKYGGWVKARETGKIETVGKEYIMKDGDIVEFKVGV